MKQTEFTLVSNVPLTADVFRMTLRGDTSAITAPGQFVDLRLAELFLRRPISVCDRDGETLTLVYRTVGRGTDKMASLPEGTRLDLLTGLGNGFDTAKSGDAPLLIGGGVGIPPLYLLAKTLRGEGKRVQVILGFNRAEEIFLAEQFRALGAEVHLTTADGSAGVKGFVTDVMKELTYTYFYTCGPMPMYRAIEKIAETSGQYSFEERMGCGFGACMGCSMMTAQGAKRVCRDGPVFEREDLIWNG